MEVIGERVLPRAARERWLKPPPEGFEPVIEDDDYLTVFIEPVSRRDPDITYTRKLARMKQVEHGMDSEWIMVSDVEWGPSVINDVITRVRIYEMGTLGEALVDTDLINAIYVSIGDRFKFVTNEFRVVMSP